MCALVASPRLCPQRGETALDKAQEYGRTEVAELLQAPTRDKSLYDAANNGDMAGVTAALDLGAPASWPNPEVSAESAVLRGERHPCVQGATLL